MDDKCTNCIHRVNSGMGDYTCVLLDDGKKCKFQRNLGPEDMFKALYMLLYQLGGEVSIGRDDFNKFDDSMRVEMSFEDNRYVLETSHKPPVPKPKSKIIGAGPKNVIKGPHYVLVPKSNHRNN